MEAIVGKVSDPEAGMVAAVPADPAALQTSTSALTDVATLTPMMRQYVEMKAEHPNAILFFRLGDFYEMFFEDAVRASALLKITLTSRAKGEGRVPMCGVPYHSARRYIARLIQEGLCVAICEQTQAEEGKGATLFKREVVRVITPGMVLDDEVLEARENNFLAAVALSTKQPSGPFGAAVIDASTGEFSAILAQGVDELAESLARLSPRELLVPEDEALAPALERLRGRLGPSVALSTLPRNAFDPGRAEAYLKAHFKVGTLDGFGLAEAPAAVGAAGAALRYLKETQRTDATHIERLTLMPRGGFLEIDEASRANLELLRTLQGGNKKGSLLGVLDRTCTGMGARKLARWLIAPLADQASIDARLDAVEELFPRAVWRDELCALLSGIGDLERLCARLTLGVGNARDLRALGQSLLALPKLASSLASARAPLLQGLCGPLEALGSLGEQLDQAILEEPKTTLKDGGLFKRGFDAELDGLLGLSSSGKDLLLQIEARERARTGISSLKVRYNKVFGYYLEITRANLDRVPADYIRKQTTVGAERFVTPELKDHEEKVLSAEERAASLEFTLYEALRQRVISQARQVRAAAEAVALCDTLVCFARCAAEYRYVRPVVDDSGVIDIIEGRHPVVERMIGAEPFVPNDVRLDRAEAQLLILTGPNMAGKSTVMRQVALITVMAQAGCFVPAQSARIGLCDRVFTRVGAADNLARGQSTFMVEMSETANILHHATARSLVILDEIGRGTSTFDGLSIAWAVAEHLHDRVGARTLFATHYHELVDLAREKARVKNRSIAVQELNGKVLFLRKLVEGGASRSYGIEVARLAGLPGDVLCRAREILANLESGELDQDGHPRPARRAPHPAPSDSQLGLFAPATRPVDRVEQQLVGELREVSLDHLSPLEALNLLFAWKQRL